MRHRSPGGLNGATVSLSGRGASLSCSHTVLSPCLHLASYSLESCLTCYFLTGLIVLVFVSPLLSSHKIKQGPNMQRGSQQTSLSVLVSNSFPCFFSIFFLFSFLCLIPPLSLYHKLLKTIFYMFCSSLPVNFAVHFNVAFHLTAFFSFSMGETLAS